MTANAALGPADIVQGQLDAYNAQDLDAFCAFYADDAVLGAYNGEVATVGLAAIRERHAKLFAEFPQNKAELKNRIVVGAHVIDHEQVLRAPGGESFQVAPIYTLAGGKIARVDFVK
ncbi:nuclear transport factor 2 family protein [Phenylobacterium sp.]|uniref:nuclear transport factor 2 family protein n=1 Tax=Phenylobacterium sp. TaxID=1871053 RepID=UPI0025CDD68F|nr:nuclear transport factor 2 family protein [Phenylobacterium sp.]